MTEVQTSEVDAEPAPVSPVKGKVWWPFVSYKWNHCEVMDVIVGTVVEQLWSEEPIVQQWHLGTHYSSIYV
jgi:hypothetical protein